MNILIVSMANSKRAKVGGKHVHQELLQKGWAESGHTVVTAFPRPKSLFRRGFGKIRNIVSARSNYQIFTAGLENTERDLCNRVIAAARAMNFDCISTQDSLSTVAAARAMEKLRQRVKIVMTLHGYFTREEINYQYFGDDTERFRALGMELERKASRSADRIIAVDSRIRDYMRGELQYQGPIDVLFNAIDDCRFFPVNAKEKGRIRRDLGIDAECVLLLVARRLVKKNGVIHALEGFRELSADGDDRYVLCLVGDGPERRNLMQYVSAEGLSDKVLPRGNVSHDDVDVYYKAADIILLPSIRSDDVEEATSLSMLEGMACGKPVIASAIGGLREIIRDRENGFLVPEKAPGEIASAVRAVMSDAGLYERIGSAAAAFVKEKHGYLAHARKVAGIYAS